MNEHIHSGPHEHLVGECAWSHHGFGVDLSCDEAVCPGELLCDRHRKPTTTGENPQ